MPGLFEIASCLAFVLCGGTSTTDFQAFNWRQTSSLWTPERKSLHCKTLRNWNPLLITHPAHTCVFEHSFVRGKTLSSFQLWESEWPSCCWIPEFNSNALINPILSPVAPWLLKPLEFAILAPNQIYPQTSSNQNWSSLPADFDGFQWIYTDVFEAGAAVAAAAMSGPKLLVKHLPNISSIFSAEARGILLAPSII